MFVETKREGEIVAKPRPSLAGLIGWLETQNPTTRYNWSDVSGCLVCKYYDALGVNNWCATDRPWYHDTFGGDGQKYIFVGGTEPWTYGDALIRARSIAG